MTARMILMVGLATTILAKEMESPRICQDKRGGAIYKLPPLLNCDEEKFDSWEIKLWKKNIKEYTGKIKGVKIIRRTCTTKVGFLGDKEVLKKKTYEILPQDTVDTLFRQGSCVNSDGYTTLSSDGKDFKCPGEWMKTKTTVVMECLHYEGAIVKRHGQPGRTDLTSFHGCTYGKGRCRAKDGMYLRWTPEEIEEEEYNLQGRYSAVATENHLLIPKLAMVLTVTEGKGPWDSGVFRIEKIEEKGNENKTLKRVGNVDGIEALREEINARLEYLAETMKSPRAKLEYLCDIWNQVRKNEIVASSWNPTKYAQLKLGYDKLIAKNTGEYLMVYPCQNVNEWRWGNKTNRCWKEVPIQYRLPKDTKWTEGYLDPNTNIIARRGTEVPCLGKEIATELNNRLESHTQHGIQEINTTKVVTLDDAISGIPMIDFLNAEWAYDDSELSNTELDRITDERDTSHPGERDPEINESPHGIWKLVGLKTLAWDAVLNWMWLWFTRIVCLIYTTQTIGKWMWKIGENKLKEIKWKKQQRKRNVWFSRRQPRRRSDISREQSEDSEDEEESSEGEVVWGP
eukprot:sb/3463459/